ncbi:MAG: T9SS type A sorting domain-containing protein, partial [Bacteroidota bacterium]|nr:T9SS type A sorting domain-containing protein [Bacteroidota bacterium]MDX5431224.1 T9SS type A sorting domain-containing protein [Bacteroidota bacterium]MDX5469963.1 T9SS type A sorting domain-containing protein [Bacteroidota bacterium]
TSLSQQGGSDTTFTDTNIEKGKVYEYCVNRNMGTTNLYGFIAAGIEAELVHYRGEVFIALDSALNQSLEEDLQGFYQSLVGDGWRVHPVVIQSEWGVNGLKDTIKTWHQINPHRHNTLLLFGDIPVPYSGNLNPDAHPDHKGAWPTDTYYGEFQGNWTDGNSYPGATRPENVNLPGDGKFDQTIIPGEVKLQIGRVYLDKLSTFGLSRDSLYRRYLTKDLAYRMNEWNVPRRGLIDDQLNALGGEYPGRNGFQNGNALFGAEGNITSYDTFIKILRTEPYLFSHASSTGGYTSNKQLNSTMFKTATYSVFQTSFGSYHGDWDINNNLLRAEIAGPGYGLTAVWAGRPQWHFLHMSMGYPVGYSARITQSNFIDANHQTYDPGYGAGWVHVTLMGDPTLRLHMISPASNLLATPNGTGDQVNLTWDASSDPAVVGYMIYKSDSLFGIWNAVNDQPLAGTSFTDEHPLTGNNTYMVRAVKLENAPGGTYYNMSQGTFASCTTTSGDGELMNLEPLQAKLQLYPNPSTGWVNIELPEGMEQVVRIYDMQGRMVKELSASSHQLSVNLNDLTPGLYVVKSGTLSEKLSLIR